MQRFSYAIVMVCLGITAQAQADTLLGVYAGADLWQSNNSGRFANNEPMQTFDFKDSSQQAYYVAFEHFVPIVPNVRLQHLALETQGGARLGNDLTFAGRGFNAGEQITSSLTLRSTDYILYYELFDNPLFSFDLGLSAKHLKGDFAVANTAGTATEKLNQWLPMLYLDTKVSIWATGLDVFVSGSLSAVKDGQLYDAQAGVAYQLIDTLLVDARLKLGFRAMDLRLDSLDNLYADMTFKGVFAGIELHF